METQKVQKLETGKSYQIEFKNDSFIVLNGIVIHKRIIEQLDFIQTSGTMKIDPINRIKEIDNSGYAEIASQFAEIFSYMSMSAKYTKEELRALDLMESLSFNLSMIKDLSVSNEIGGIIRDYFKHNIDSFVFE